MLKGVLKFFCVFMFLTGILNSPVYADEPAVDNNKDIKQSIELENPNKKDTETNIVPVLDLKGGVQKQTVEEVKPDTPFKLWINGDTASGNWLGLRTKLNENGIEPNFSYNNDSMFKATGGFENKSKLKAISLINMELNADTEKMHLWRGGKFYVLGQNVHGKGLSGATIGDMQNVSSLAAHDITQLGEYWYQQGLLSDKIKFKLGKQDASKDFAVLDSCSNLLNASFTLLPNVPIPAYPNPGIGVAGFVQLTNRLSLKSGIYDGEAKGSTSGFDTTFGKDRSFISISELAVKPNIKNYEGNYLVGFWHHSGDYDEISDSDTPRIYTGNYGIYTSFEQFIYKKPDDKNSDKGLKIFGQFSWAPSDRTDLSKYYDYGLCYKGLLKGRDSDITGIAGNIAQLSGRLKSIDGRTRESAIEVYHKFQLNKWFALQPDVQIIINPDGQYKNAFVMGVRTIIIF